MKILIIKPSSLGDIVHALRVVAFLKKQLNPEIHWVVKKGLEGIIQASGIVDKYYLFHRGNGLAAFLRLGLTLRKESYDIVLDMQGLLRSAFLAKLTKGKLCLGRPDGREFSTFFYKTTNFPIQNDPHAIDRLCMFLDFFKIQSDQKLLLDFKESKISDLHKKLLNSNKRKIIIFPESRRSEKCWPFFGNLTDSLIKEDVGDVIISGMIKDKNHKGAIDLRGEVQLSCLPALIREAAFVVSNDSAPLHIASSLGVSVLGIFGPTNSSHYGPYPRSSKNSFTVSSATGLISDISEKDVIVKIMNILEKA